MRPKRYGFLLCIVTVFLSISFANATAQQRVTYIVSVPSPSKHVFYVEMEMPGTAGPLKLRIPAFQPGDPGPKHYARFIEHVKVAIGEQDLPTKRIDPNTWVSALPQSGTVRIAYDVEVDPKDQLQLDNHWVDETGGYFDSTSLLLYSDESAHLPVFLKLNLPPEWKVATLLPKQDDGFSAKDYLRLVDAPVVFGSIVERTISVNGIPHRLVFPTSLPSYDSAKLDSYIEKISAYEIKLFGSVHQLHQSVPLAAGHSLWRRDRALRRNVHEYWQTVDAGSPGGDEWHLRTRIFSCLECGGDSRPCLARRYRSDSDTRL